MSLKQELKEGDWIRATHSQGGVIEGQASTDKSFGGFANMEIVVAPNLKITINLNQWDVVLLKANLLDREF